MKMAGVPSCPLREYEIPPMSERSHSASSGKSEIIACSDPCSPPMKCSSRRTASASSSSGSVNQKPSVSKTIGGASRGCLEIVAWSLRRLRAYSVIRTVTFRRPKNSPKRPRSVRRSVSRISVSLLPSACV